MTALVFLNNRYHDPALGSFISVDPLVTITGEAYVYGHSNPIVFSDPTGLIYEDPDNSYSAEVAEYSLNVWKWKKEGYSTATTYYASYTLGWGFETLVYDPNTGENVAKESVRDYAALSEGFLNPIVDTCLATAGSSCENGSFVDALKGAVPGVLVAVSIVGGAACILATGAPAAAACAYGAYALAGANIAWSANENLLGDEQCWGNFGLSVVTNATPLGVSRAAGGLPDEMVEGARRMVAGIGMVNSQIAQVNACGG